LANYAYWQYINIENMEERYASIAVKILYEAQRTTAGLLINFYEDI